MKILHVNTTDISGGAARAVYRLHHALLRIGINSQMLVQSKESDDFTVTGPQSNFQKLTGKIRPFLDRLPAKLYKNRSKVLFSSGWIPFSSTVKRINKINPDIVHLHWIAGGMVRIEDIARIKAPIVWSLHDDWGFTGGCHIKWECERYKEKCGKCPRLGSKKVNDLSRKVFLRKKKTFSKISNLTVIGLSKWLANCAKESTLFKEFDVINLPNLLNTSVYAPFDKTQARKLLNLPQDVNLVAFGAMSATSDINKGFNELSEALLQLNSANTELVVFGSRQPKFSQGFKQKAHYLGQLHDDVSLRLLYSAADVMVVPSLQEAFGQTASESMACGTPVVAFGTTGLLDIVEHKKTGYLANPYDIEDLANGMKWVLNATNYDELSENARAKVLKEFDSNVVATEYGQLYKKVLKKNY